jgi:hypothetical protein
VRKIGGFYGYNDEAQLNYQKEFCVRQNNYWLRFCYILVIFIITTVGGMLMRNRIESVVWLSAVIIALLSAGNSNGQARQAVLFKKMSDFPIADSGGWSALSGKYIIYKDTAGRFTRINVSDPSKPDTAGYLDSVSLMAYSQATLIPAFLQFGVTDNYAKTRVVKSGGVIFIATDSLVQMFTASGNALMKMGVLTVIHGASKEAIQLLLLNETLFEGLVSVISCSTSVCVGSQPCSNFLDYSVYVISNSRISKSTCSFRIYDFNPISNGEDYEYTSIRPYFNCSTGFPNEKRVYISQDSFSYQWWHRPLPYGSASRRASACVSKIKLIDSSVTIIPIDTPYCDAFNTGRRISATKTLCTNGFPIDNRGFSFKPGNTATRLFAADTGDFHPLATATSLGAVYIDTVHKQNQIQNIILDTITKRVYLLFTNNMTILSYQNAMVEAGSHAKNPLPLRELTVISNAPSRGVTVILPDHPTAAGIDLAFYDLSGRMIGGMRGLTAHAVTWKPHAGLSGCTIVTAKIDGRTLTGKFMIR